MTYRVLCFNILMSVLCCCYSPIIIPAQKMMNPQQMQDFERELEEANRAIEEYVSSLSPAEQAEFNRQVEEMSRMFENMNEDEFEKFLGEMFSDEPMTEPNPFTEIQPVVQDVPQVASLNAEDKKKAETALKVLDDIIKQSNLFMVLVNSSPELPNRITRWGAQEEISNWQAGTKWDDFKATLETLIQKLYKAQEQDLSKKYKYLLELIADESLYNNLIQLQTSLNTVVPTINLPEFGIQKLSTQSKNAIKDILQKYTESFYLLNIPQGLDALFEKYAPEQEKLRSAEEAATKRAQESARAIRTPASPETAGVGDDMYGYGYGYDSYNPYGDYSYNPYDSYNPYGDYNYSDYGYDSDAGNSSGSGKGRSGGNGGGGGRSGGSRGDKEEPGKETDKDKRRPQITPQHEIERAIADIKSSLDDITAAMTDEEGNPTKLAKLADTINKDEDIDVILAGSTLPTIVDRKLDTMIEAVKTINKKTITQTDISHYQREVQKAFDKNKKELEDLSKAIDTFGKKEDIEKEVAEAKKQGLTDNADKISKKIKVEDLSEEKQWAYFGGEATLLGDDENKLEEKISSRVNLFDIKTKIDTLLTDMKKFMAKKSEVPVAPKKKEEAPIQEEIDIEELE
jgi:uncharacterized membrane protein YgcG